MTNPNRIFDFTEGARVKGDPPPQQQSALLTPQRRPWWQLPFAFAWTGWEHVLYFFAPPNGCVYCWLTRVFLVGAACGAAAVHWWPK